MLPSLSTSCLPHLPLARVMHWAAQTGFEGIELVVGPETWLRGPSWVRRQADAMGITIPSVHQSLLPITPSGAGDARMLDAARFAAELGCPRVVIHGPWAERWHSQAGQHWLAVLEQCQQILIGTDTRLALENPGVYDRDDYANVLAPINALLTFAAKHDLDLTLDTCHVGSGAPTLAEAYQVLAERIVNVHFSDIAHGRWSNNDLLRAIDAHHQMPGEGYLALQPFLQNLARDGYQGPLTFEISLFALKAWSPQMLRRRLLQAVGYVTRPIPSSLT